VGRPHDVPGLEEADLSREHRPVQPGMPVPRFEHVAHQRPRRRRGQPEQQPQLSGCELAHRWRTAGAEDDGPLGARECRADMVNGPAVQVTPVLHEPHLGEFSLDDPGP
jgi:hypothetical protein